MAGSNTARTSNDVKDSKQLSLTSSIATEEVKELEHSLDKVSMSQIKIFADLQFEIDATQFHEGRPHCFYPLPKNKIAVLIIPETNEFFRPRGASSPYNKQSALVIDIPQKQFTWCCEKILTPLTSINTIAPYLYNQDCLLTASRSYIKKWNTTTGESTCLFDYSTKSMPTPQNLLIMDNNHLATGHPDGKIRIWNISTRKSYKLDTKTHTRVDEMRYGCTLLKCNDTTLLCIINPNYYGQERILQKWNISDKKCTGSTKVGLGGTSEYTQEASLVISENEVAIPSINNKTQKAHVTIWDIEKMKPKFKLATQRLVFSLVLLPDGRLGAASYLHKNDKNKTRAGTIIEFFDVGTRKKTSYLSTSYNIDDVMLSPSTLELIAIAKSPETQASDKMVFIDIRLKQRYLKELCEAIGHLLPQQLEALVLDYLSHSGFFVSDATVSHSSVTSQVEQKKSSSDKKDPSKKQGQVAETKNNASSQGNNANVSQLSLLAHGNASGNSAYSGKERPMRPANRN